MLLTDLNNDILLYIVKCTFEYNEIPLSMMHTCSKMYHLIFNQYEPHIMSLFHLFVNKNKVIQDLCEQDEKFRYYHNVFPMQPKHVDINTTEFSTHISYEHFDLPGCWKLSHKILGSPFSSSLSSCLKWLNPSSVDKQFIYNALKSRDFSAFSLHFSQLLDTALSIHHTPRTFKDEILKISLSNWYSTFLLEDSIAGFFSLSSMFDGWNSNDDGGSRLLKRQKSQKSSFTLAISRDQKVSYNLFIHMLSRNTIYSMMKNVESITYRTIHTDKTMLISALQKIKNPKTIHVRVALSLEPWMLIGGAYDSIIQNGQLVYSYSWFQDGSIKNGRWTLCQDCGKQMVYSLVEDPTATDKVWILHPSCCKINDK